MDLLIHGGRVVDPSQNMDQISDVLIRGGVVEAIEPNIAIDVGVSKYDASGLIVAPGFIDPHSHFRDPGHTHRETLESGSMAAAAGGYTSAITMANTNPPIDTPEHVRTMVERGKAECVVNLYVMASITIGRRGEELCSYESLLEAGAVGFGDDAPLDNSKVLADALSRSAELGLPFGLYCDDRALSRGARINAGAVARGLGLPGNPSVAEAAMMARDLTIGAMTGAHVHILHVSTKEGVALIRQAKANGAKVTAEVSAHHFTLTDEDITKIGPNAMIGPPLRTVEDLRAIQEALADGTIDLVGTDHAPHAAHEKTDIASCNLGLIGLETAFSQALDELVRPGTISLSLAISLFSCNAAKLYSLDGRGSLRRGACGDVSIIDIDRKWTVLESDICSKSKNTPYLGREFKGCVVSTIINGDLILDRRNSEGWTWLGERGRFPTGDRLLG